MIQAAGVMIVAPCPVSGADTVLMLLRGGGSDHSFEWALPGGRIEEGESAAEGAARECEEECGLAIAPADLGPALTRGIARAEAPATPEGEVPPPPSEDVDFTAFVRRQKAQFEPKLSGEHIGYAWAPLDRPPGPTHPGALIALQRPAMNELDVARAMAKGSLVSPQRYGDLWLFALRITGTGVAYRPSLGEGVWRDPDEYLTEEFLARCNGLPVVWVHPAKATLDGKEFKRRAIGTVFLPFLGQPGKPEVPEVWAIAKVYDEAAIEGMSDPDNPLSTSPSVVLASKRRMELDDGRKVLVEGDSKLLDHLAVVAGGVWDKGDEPNGIEVVSDSLGGPVPQGLDPEKLLLAQLELARLNTRLALAG